MLMLAAAHRFLAKSFFLQTTQSCWVSWEPQPEGSNQDYLPLFQNQGWASAPDLL